MNTLIYGSISPIDVVVGIDNATFQLRKGQPFAGIKNIPPGIHVVHWGDDSMRYGYWFDSKQKYYIRYNEAFELVKLTDDAAHDLGAASHLQFMVPCPDDESWRDLSRYVSQEQVHSITGDATGYADSSMTSLEEAELLHETLSRGHEARTATTGTEPKFHYHPIKFKSRQAIRSDHRQEDFLDKSYYLNDVLLSQFYGHRFDRLLGELQFAFLNAMVFGNYGSSLQWHSFIELICLSSRVSADTIARLDKVLALQLESLQQEYVDFLLSPTVWDRILYKSFHGDQLRHTRQALEHRAPDLLEEVIDDDNDEFEPTIVSGVYYRQR
ncbi:AAR2 (YBL074C) [Zygosaccharomyces parabailii]|uniref:ZYBA0S08-02564g1_1 n=1 Tax=Zygosaccharomyces bailii (strain CLIB 213 / ATCC 58445 / CBS 680 / BCRC 21525 / NBRC 1098 / NCYC 1416 / NRRL Y-2227) TaxID=1333698 RepID=A0A8J2X372_ZYGB2|nr:AAR2 (YBL074C) [Zygosaccharomyces parabailii]CDF90768.1 ZYBA0S08-02564g1_1 [Zygosaccharomyces bailii CLIB 213]